ncbi:MAG: glycosyltransferase family 4 protein, partial [Pseudomonadota bacterium]
MSTPAPVLLIVPSLVRAGAETQVVSLANGLAERGYEVHLASFGTALDQLDRVDRSRVRFHALRREDRLGLGLVRQLARLMDTHRYAVVHCTLQISLFYGFLARWRSRHKAPLIAAIHTTLNLSVREERFDRWLYRPLLGRCAHVMFVCQAQAR